MELEDYLAWFDDKSYPEAIRQLLLRRVGILPPELIRNPTWENVPVGFTPDQLITAYRDFRILNNQWLSTEIMGKKVGSLTIDWDQRNVLKQQGLYLYPAVCDCGQKLHLPAQDVLIMENLGLGCMSGGCSVTPVVPSIFIRSYRTLTYAFNQFLSDNWSEFVQWQDREQARYDGWIAHLDNGLKATIRVPNPGYHWVEFSRKESDGTLQINRVSPYPLKSHHLSEYKVCMDPSGPDNWVPLEEAAVGLDIDPFQLLEKSLTIAPWLLVDHLE